MKLLYCCLLLLGAGVLAEERVKRQATYTFPGPRSSDRGYRSGGGSPVYVEEQDEQAYQPSPRRQFQAQPVQQPQYAPSQPRSPAPAPAAPAPPPVYEPAPRAPEPRQQSAPRRRASTSSSSSSSGRANKYGSAPAQSLNDAEEEDTGPDALTLLLQDSQFACSGKQDGYYADDSVNCQVFHYCVGGAKHSWMCPENTVFHQVHLNCVPDAQDICSQSQKFHFVNDYLYKPVDYEGPNNTARYSQRYYPDGYVVGDPLVSPQEQQPRRPAQAPPQSYSAPAPAPRPPQRAPAPPPQPAYRAPPQQSPSYRQQAPASRPASRPSRPVESYPVEVPEGYNRAAPQPQPAPQAAYRQPQTSAPRQQAPPEAYSRQVVREPPSSSSYSSEENLYQPQPQPQARSRPAQAAVQARPTAGYAPQPREQYSRPSARSSGGGYPVYGSNQAAGVQYDEDY